MSASSSAPASGVRGRARARTLQLGVGLRLRWGLLGAAVLGASLLAGLAIGPASLSVGAILADIASRLPGLHIGRRLDPLDAAVLWQIRAPRVILGALVGGTLASAGAGYQAVFRNPLAEPYLLGVAAGAGLGATAEIVYGPPGARSLLIAAAFAGALLAVAAAYALGRSLSGRDVSTLILAGIAVSLFLTAVQTFLLQEHTQSTAAVYSWLLGSLNTSGWSDVLLVLPYVAFSLVVLSAHRRVLDVLRLGDEEAEALGVNVARVRLLVVLASTLGTAAVVAVSGLIGFVGVVLPHTVRLLINASYRVIIPLSAAFGAAFLVLADVVSRTALSPAEVPVGVMTAFIGAPCFALVLRATRPEAL
ncbi:MAG TPA: iron ABC transporter permease [Solirubrobacteraceae bacterium]|nr:iron ABC transporter permease [Solirubrobacteraceae bacterium]